VSFLPPHGPPLPPVPRPAARPPRPARRAVAKGPGGAGWSPRAVQTVLPALSSSRGCRRSARPDTDLRVPVAPAGLGVRCLAWGGDRLRICSFPARTLAGVSTIWLLPVDPAPNTYSLTTLRRRQRSTSRSLAGVLGTHGRWSRVGRFPAAVTLFLLQRGQRRWSASAGFPPSSSTRRSSRRCRTSSGART